MRYIASLLIFAFCCDARYVPTDGIYSVAEEMPAYSDGMESFKDYVESRVNACDTIDSLQIKPGRVMVSFTIMKDSTLSECKVLRGINDHQDQIALQIIQETPEIWLPGKNQGKEVNVKLTYPIIF